MPMIIPGIVAAIGVVAEAAGAAAASLTLGLGGSLAAASVIGEAVTVGVPAVIEFGALAGVSALLAPRPHLNVAGSPQQTKYDPQAPIPCVMGRYGVGGNVIYRTTSGGASKAVHGAAGNEFLTEFNILSGLGPIQGIETLRFDDTVLYFEGETCKGGYIEAEYVQYYNPGYKFTNPDGSYVNNNFVDHAWENRQLGAVPSGGFAYPTEIANSNDQLTEWTSAMGLSGFAASALTISYDVTVYAGGEPQKQWVVDGYLTYDPRLDSTYPGGSGGHRYLGAGADNADLMTARATHAWSDNPAIHALNYALGHFLPDPVTGSARLYAGIGAGITGVDVASFVAAANVMDANGWKICGQWTTGDGKWSVLTAMLQAGGATPINDRGRISCMVSTPRTSLGSITAADLAGDVTLDTGVSMRERINTVFARYSSPEHRWQIVQADTPVRAETYVAEDGGVRSKTLTFEYVYTVNQACQLAAYAICDGREIPAIVITGKPHLRNYAVGDCVTLDIPEAGLGGIKAVVTKRSTSIATGGCTLTLRSETDAKHAYSLGISGTAPATPGISGFDPSIVPAPIPASWAAAEAVLSDPASGATVHVIQIDGTTIDNLYATDVIVEYAPVTSVAGVDTDGAFVTQTFDASVTTINLHLAAGRYHVLLRYVISTGAQSETDYLDLGIITVGAGVAGDTANVGGTSAAGVLSELAALQADVVALQTGAAPDIAAAQEAATQAQAAEAAALGSATTAAGQATQAGAYSSQAGAYEAASSANAGTATEQASVATTNAGYAQSYAAAADASSAAATASAALVADYNPGANLIRNPSWSQGLAYWLQSNGASFYDDAQNVGGPCLTCAPGAVQTVDDSVYSGNQTAQPGAAYSMQIECISGGLSGGTIYVGVDWHTPGEPEQYTTIVPPQNNGGWTRYTLPDFQPPPGATSYNVYVNSSDIAFGAGGYLAFRKFKLELGSTCTPFTDDQTGASILDAASVAADATSAVAGRTSTLEATVDDPSHGNLALSASVTTAQGAISTLQGKTAAYWGLDLSAGASHARVKVFADGVGSAITLAADLFEIDSPAGGNQPFLYDADAGRLYVNDVDVHGDLVVDGTITQSKIGAVAVSTDKIQPNAVSVVYSSTASDLVRASGAQQLIFEHDFYLDRDSQIVALASCQFREIDGGHSASEHQDTLMLAIDDNPVASNTIAGALAATTYTLTGAATLNGGAAHNVKMYATAHTFDGYDTRTLITQIFMA